MSLMLIHILIIAKCHLVQWPLGFEARAWRDGSDRSGIPIPIGAFLCRSTHSFELIHRRVDSHDVVSEGLKRIAL